MPRLTRALAFAVMALAVALVGVRAARDRVAALATEAAVTQPDWERLRTMPLFPAIEAAATPYWIGLVLKDRRAGTLAQIEALPPETRRVIWLAFLDANWGRDGLHTFFLERGEFAPEIARALADSGLTRQAAVFAQVMALFGQPYPRDHAVRARPFAWSRPGRRVDAITTIPNEPNAFGERLFALSRELGSRAEYRRAVEDAVTRDPTLAAWAEGRRAALTDADRLGWLTQQLYVATPEAMAGAMRGWPPVYRTLYLLDLFNAEMLNGGVHQFFFNSSGALAPDVAEALAEVGLPQHADAVRRGIALFAAPYPRDTGLRRARYFRGADWTPFDEALGALTGAVDDGAIPGAMTALAAREGVLAR